MSDGLTVLGPDGIRRSYDEHYDTMMDVEQDPTGAHQAIQRQHARIEELEAKLEKAVDALGEAIYLLDPDEEDIAKETGLHRIVTTYTELTGDNND